MAIAGPHLEGATNAAVGADGFGAFNLLLAQMGVDHRDAGNNFCPGGVLEGFDDVNQRALQRLAHRSERPGVGLHALLHQRITGADRHAVPTADAAGTGNLRAAVPQHARVLHGVIDAQGLIHFNILAGIHTAAAENALIGIVGIKGVGVIFDIGFALKGIALNRDMHIHHGVMQCAVASVVFADGAVEFMFCQQPIHPLFARRAGGLVR